MSILSIFAKPDVGQVGVGVQLSFEGSLSGSEARWFLRERPLGSTLATGTRLDGSLNATLEPDVAGRYVVAVKDVAVTIPAPRWDGDPLATAPTDDEATAPEITREVWVAEAISREIAAGKGKATLSLWTYDDRADETRTELVTLVPGQGVALGADTLADPYLAGILNELRTALDLSTFLGPSVAFLADLWRALFVHTDSAVLAVHASADVTPTPSGAPTTLAGCQSLLPALEAELLAHEALSLPIHGQPAPLTPVGLSIGTTLAEACVYAAALDRALAWHATTVYHPAGGATVHAERIADWTEGRWQEPPHDLTTLCTLSADLAARLAAHKARGPSSTIVSHQTFTVALPNPFAPGMPSSLAFAAVGQMVDVFSTHVQSFTGDATPGAHSAKRPAPGITRPGDPASCALAAEALCLTLEQHALDEAAHGGQPALGATRARAGTDPATARWPYTLRMSARLAQLLSSATPPVPENRNAAATLWRVFGGFK